MKIKNRLILLISIFSVLVFIGCARIETYGRPISNKRFTRIEDIVRNPDIYKNKAVTIGGKLINECPTGCWFYIKEGEAVIYVNIEPAGFAIPQKSGHAAVVEGRVLVEGRTPKISGTGVEVK